MILFIPFFISNEKSVGYRDKMSPSEAAQFEATKEALEVQMKMFNESLKRIK